MHLDSILACHDGPDGDAAVAASTAEASVSKQSATSGCAMPAIVVGGSKHKPTKFSTAVCVRVGSPYPGVP
jgi:hypothetical protein